MNATEKTHRYMLCQRMINKIQAELGPDEMNNWTFITRQDPNTKEDGVVLWYGSHISGMAEVRPMYGKPEVIVLGVNVSENEFTNMNFTGSGSTFKQAWLECKRAIDAHLNRINWTVANVLPTKVEEV